MTSRLRSLITATLIVILGTVAACAQTTAAPAPGLLNRTEAAAILPAKVFFRGQSATIQGRNSAGIRVADGKLILFTVVDTSGYSSAIQQNYQAYLLTEVPLHIGDHTLAPGAYGFGFIANNQMIVMDIGGNELFRTATVHDAEIARPTPLQLLAQPGSADHYRLYLGRTYVVLSPVSK
ncbi:hypothetical protein GOB94_07960 [Granulicella sp. 5B5]|uniref:hypothetical protein n=1 Tax=Granulicella sp. 5B5 TaxID=1617967 RepID=UPI0015F444AF|nr:hypothetical protein [Granulicella sp. 5B5]QMV18626.1 hypothetical protein GOB94_07960 [Granulicella sp. 5B5]